jgi:hypothetical protein
MSHKTFHIQIRAKMGWSSTSDRDPSINGDGAKAGRRRRDWRGRITRLLTWGGAGGAVVASPLIVEVPAERINVWWLAGAITAALIGANTHR